MSQPSSAKDRFTTLKSLDELIAANGEAPAAVTAKLLTKLETHSRNFIARAPFLVLATHSDAGSDASPRGDEPGFVKVLDDHTILIPERPGNRLADSMRNVIQNPAVGLIFMIPGMNETLRVNGEAFLTQEPELLAQLAHKGKPPTLAFVVDIKQVYFHCAKAFIRSKLWSQEALMPREEMPTLGKILLDQIKKQDVTDEEVTLVDQSLDQDAEDNLYH